MKRFLAILGIFGFTVDAFDALVEKRLAEPSLRNDFVKSNPTLRTSGQGDVTFDSGMEIGADVAHYQERNYATSSAGRSDFVKKFNDFIDWRYPLFGMAVGFVIGCLYDKILCLISLLK